MTAHRIDHTEAIKNKIVEFLKSQGEKISVDNIYRTHICGYSTLNGEIQIGRQIKYRFTSDFNPKTHEAELRLYRKCLDCKWIVEEGKE